MRASTPDINKRAQLSDSVGAGLCSARVWLIPQLLKSGGVEPRPYRQRGFFRKARDICCVSARSIAPSECVSSRYITYALSRYTTGWHRDYLTIHQFHALFPHRTDKIQRPDNTHNTAARCAVSRSAHRGETIFLAPDPSPV